MAMVTLSLTLIFILEGNVDHDILDNTVFQHDKASWHETRFINKMFFSQSRAEELDWLLNLDGVGVCEWTDGRKHP